MTISRDYTKGSGGTLRVELGGPTAGDEHDVPVVAGTANLAGELRSVSGQFVEVTGPGEFTVTYEADAVTLTVADEAPATHTDGEVAADPDQSDAGSADGDGGDAGAGEGNHGGDANTGHISQGDDGDATGDVGRESQAHEGNGPDESAGHGDENPDDPALPLPGRGTAALILLAMCLAGMMLTKPRHRP